MKNSIIVILLLSCLKCFATVETFKYISYPNVNICLISNHEQWGYKEYFHYKGIGDILNRYIQQKKDAGLLENKTFEIKIISSVFGGYGIEVSQNQKHYFITYNDWADLEFLVKIVDYFTVQDWESFCNKNTRYRYLQQLRKTFEQHLADLGIKPDMSQFANDVIELWELDKLKICYSPDSLYYLFNGNNIQFKPANILPAKLQDRYFITSGDSIVIFNNDVTVMTKKIPNYNIYDSYTYKLIPYKSWLDLFHYNKVLSSYSYDKNKFYNIK